MTVTLRQLDEAAARAIMAGGCPPGLRCAPDYPATGDRIAAGMYIERCAAGADPGPFGAFLICVAAAPDADLLVVGGIGFHGGPDERGRVEIGYAVVPSYEGRGLATQALAMLVARARELQVRVIVAEAETSNAASQAVLRSGGFGQVAANERAVHFELPL